jgi:hypothetical protein
MSESKYKLYHYTFSVIDESYNLVPLLVAVLRKPTSAPDVLLTSITSAI